MPDLSKIYKTLKERDPNYIKESEQDFTSKWQGNEDKLYDKLATDLPGFKDSVPRDSYVSQAKKNTSKIQADIAYSGNFSGVPPKIDNNAPKFDTEVVNRSQNMVAPAEPTVAKTIAPDTDPLEYGNAATNYKEKMKLYDDSEQGSQRGKYELGIQSLNAYKEAANNTFNIYEKNLDKSFGPGVLDNFGKQQALLITGVNSAKSIYEKNPANQKAKSLYESAVKSYNDFLEKNKPLTESPDFKNIQQLQQTQSKVKSYEDQLKLQSAPYLQRKKDVAIIQGMKDIENPMNPIHVFKDMGESAVRSVGRFLQNVGEGFNSDNLLEIGTRMIEDNPSSTESKRSIIEKTVKVGDKKYGLDQNGKPQYEILPSGNTLDVTDNVDIPAGTPVETKFNTNAAFTTLQDVGMDYLITSALTVGVGGGAKLAGTLLKAKDIANWTQKGVALGQIVSTGLTVQKQAVDRALNDGASLDEALLSKVISGLGYGLVSKVNPLESKMAERILGGGHHEFTDAMAKYAAKKIGFKELVKVAGGQLGKSVLGENMEEVILEPLVDEASAYTSSKAFNTKYESSIPSLKDSAETAIITTLFAGLASSPNIDFSRSKLLGKAVNMALEDYDNTLVKLEQVRASNPALTQVGELADILKQAKEANLDKKKTGELAGLLYQRANVLAKIDETSDNSVTKYKYDAIKENVDQRIKDLMISSIPNNNTLSGQDAVISGNNPAIEDVSNQASQVEPDKTTTKEYTTKSVLSADGNTLTVKGEGGDQVFKKTDKGWNAVTEENGVTQEHAIPEDVYNDFLKPNLENATQKSYTYNEKRNQVVDSIDNTRLDKVEVREVVDGLSEVKGLNEALKEAEDKTTSSSKLRFLQNALGNQVSDTVIKHISNMLKDGEQGNIGLSELQDIAKFHNENPRKVKAPKISDRLTNINTKLAELKQQKSDLVKEHKGYIGKEGVGNKNKAIALLDKIAKVTENIDNLNRQSKTLQAKKRLANSTQSEVQSEDAIQAQIAGVRKTLGELNATRSSLLNQDKTNFEPPTPGNTEVELTAKIRQLNEELNSLKDQLENTDDSIGEPPTLTKDDLSKLDNVRPDNSEPTEDKSKYNFKEGTSFTYNGNTYTYIGKGKDSSGRIFHTFKGPFFTYNFFEDKNTQALNSLTQARAMMEGSPEAAKAVEAVNKSLSQKIKERVKRFFNEQRVKNFTSRLNKAFPDIKVEMNTEKVKQVWDAQQGRPYSTSDGKIYGYELGGTIYINLELAGIETPIHEFGHIWNTYAKTYFPDLYYEGLQKVANSPYMVEIFNHTGYRSMFDAGIMSYENMAEEALATAIGRVGADFLKGNLITDFKRWANKLYNDIYYQLGMVPRQGAKSIGDLTIEEFVKDVVDESYNNRFTHTMSYDNTVKLARPMLSKEFADHNGLSESKVNEVVNKLGYFAGDLTWQIKDKEKFDKAFTDNIDEEIRRGNISADLSLHDPENLDILHKVIASIGTSEGVSEGANLAYNIYKSFDKQDSLFQKMQGLEVTINGNKGTVINETPTHIALQSDKGVTFINRNDINSIEGVPEYVSDLENIEKNVPLSDKAEEFYKEFTGVIKNKPIEYYGLANTEAESNFMAEKIYKNAGIPAQLTFGQAAEQVEPIPQTVQENESLPENVPGPDNSKILDNYLNQTIAKNIQPEYDIISSSFNQTEEEMNARRSELEKSNVVHAFNSLSSAVGGMPESLEETLSKGQKVINRDKNNLGNLHSLKSLEQAYINDNSEFYKNLTELAPTLILRGNVITTHNLDSFMNIMDSYNIDPIQAFNTNVLLRDGILHIKEGASFDEIISPLVVDIMNRNPSLYDDTSTQALNDIFNKYIGNDLPFTAQKEIKDRSFIDKEIKYSKDKSKYIPLSLVYSVEVQPTRIRPMLGDQVNKGDLELDKIMQSISKHPELPPSVWQSLLSTANKDGKGLLTKNALAKALSFARANYRANLNKSVSNESIKAEKALQRNEDLHAILEANTNHIEGDQILTKAYLKVIYDAIDEDGKEILPEGAMDENGLYDSSKYIDPYTFVGTVDKVLSDGLHTSIEAMKTVDKFENGLYLSQEEIVGLGFALQAVKQSIDDIQSSIDNGEHTGKNLDNANAYIEDLIDVRNRMNDALRLQGRKAGQTLRVLGLNLVNITKTKKELDAERKDRILNKVSNEANRKNPKLKRELSADLERISAQEAKVESLTVIDSGSLIDEINRMSSETFKAEAESNEPVTGKSIEELLAELKAIRAQREPIHRLRPMLGESNMGINPNGFDADRMRNRESALIFQIGKLLLRNKQNKITTFEELTTHIQERLGDRGITTSDVRVAFAMPHKGAKKRTVDVFKKQLTDIKNQAKQIHNLGSLLEGLLLDKSTVSIDVDGTPTIFKNIIVGNSQVPKWVTQVSDPATGGIVNQNATDEQLAKIKEEVDKVSITVNDTAITGGMDKDFIRVRDGEVNIWAHNNNGIIEPATTAEISLITKKIKESTRVLNSGISLDKNIIVAMPNGDKKIFHINAQGNWETVERTKIRGVNYDSPRDATEEEVALVKNELSKKGPFIEIQKALTDILKSSSGLESAVSRAEYAEFVSLISDIQDDLPNSLAGLEVDNYKVQKMLAKVDNMKTLIKVDNVEAQIVALQRKIDIIDEGTDDQAIEHILRASTTRETSYESAELTRAKVRLRELKTQFNRRIAALDPKTADIFWKRVKLITNTFKAFPASADLSAMGIQGLALARLLASFEVDSKGIHISKQQKMVLKGSRVSIGSFGINGITNAERFYEDLREHLYWPLMEKTKLGLTAPTETGESAEELFREDLMDIAYDKTINAIRNNVDNGKLKDILETTASIVTLKGMKGRSEAAYVSYLNGVRASMFIAYIDARKVHGIIPTIAELNIVSQSINNITQKSSTFLGKDISPVLTAAGIVLWAPKMYLANLKLIPNTLYKTGQYAANQIKALRIDQQIKSQTEILNNPNSSDEVKKEAANIINELKGRKDDVEGLARAYGFAARQHLYSLATFVSLNAAMYQLLKLVCKQKPEISMNYTDSNFAKLGCGGYNRDYTGNTSGYLRLMLQVGDKLGESLNLWIAKAGYPRYNRKTEKDLLWDFFSAKTSPSVSTPVQTLTNKDFYGQPIYDLRQPGGYLDAVKFAVGNLTPLSLRELFFSGTFSDNLNTFKDDPIIKLIGGSVGVFGTVAGLTLKQPFTKDIPDALAFRLQKEGVDFTSKETGIDFEPLSKDQMSVAFTDKQKGKKEPDKDHFMYNLIKNRVIDNAEILLRDKLSKVNENNDTPDLESMQSDLKDTIDKIKLYVEQDYKNKGKFWGDDELRREYTNEVYAANGIEKKKAAKVKYGTSAEQELPELTSKEKDEVNARVAATMKERGFVHFGAEPKLQKEIKQFLTK